MKEVVMSGGLMLLVIGLVVGVVLSIFLILKIVIELKKNQHDFPAAQGKIEE